MNIELRCVHRSDEKCRHCSDELTFAEAMALDPSEVEFSFGGSDAVCWSRLDANPDQPLRYMRIAAFRRAKPKRSRVQEMSAQTNTVNVSAYERGLCDAIRAVCEYLRKDLQQATWVAPCIEREFLEPR